MNSIIKWIGGKHLLSKRIISLIPKHNIYCEVFGGAGWVLFGKSDDKKDWITENNNKYTEVYNDINSDLINFWKYIKFHPVAFVAELNQYLVSREIFDTLLQYEPRTELEQAVKFYYILNCSYGALSKTFSIGKGYKYLQLKDLDIVKKASERLKNVIIEKQDFEKLIKRYDTPDTFFYLDPPYYKNEHLYERNKTSRFGKHQELADILKSIDGKFLLSYNDDSFIRSLYKDFIIEEIEAPYSFNGIRRKTELLIRNYI